MLSRPMTLVSDSVVRIRLARFDPMNPDAPVINTVLEHFILIFYAPYKAHQQPPDLFHNQIFG